MPESKIVIIIVDDDPAVRDALQFSLTLEGFTVYTCRSGEELFHHPALRSSDCIVLDYKMPGLSGLDVLHRLAAVHVTAPVIFITGPLSKGLRQQALEAGACMVLEKPLLDRALTDRIRELTA